jgi:hypothetical protein
MSRPSPPRPVKRSVRLDYDEDASVTTLATRLGVDWGEGARMMLRFAAGSMSTADEEVQLAEERLRKTRANVRPDDTAA